MDDSAPLVTTMCVLLYDGGEWVQERAGMEQSERATQLLGFIDAAQAALIERASAGAVLVSAFQAISQVLAAGMSGVSDADLAKTPAPDEWSMAEVAEHVAEHDSHYMELEHHGIGHYVEHGLEHALQLWRLRALICGPPVPPGLDDGIA